MVVVWAGYRFRTGSISPQRGHHPRLEKWLGRYQAWKAAAIAVLEANLPLVSAARGVGQMWRTQRSGASSYFLGERRMHGWWYFYPVAVAVKTPLGFLMLGVAGSAALLAGARKRPWAEAAPVVYLAAVLAVSLAANVDVGVRYVLHVYPLLSLAAGYAVSEWMVKRGSRARQALVAVLVAAALVESWRAHPDYLPYFNALAGNAPERFQGDSDLDWGQDLGRLSRRLRELGVEERMDSGEHAVPGDAAERRRVRVAEAVSAGGDGGEDDPAVSGAVRDPRRESRLVTGTATSNQAILISSELCSPQRTYGGRSAGKRSSMRKSQRRFASIRRPAEVRPEKRSYKPPTMRYIGPL